MMKKLRSTVPSQIGGFLEPLDIWRCNLNRVINFMKPVGIRCYVNHCPSQKIKKNMKKSKSNCRTNIPENFLGAISRTIRWEICNFISGGILEEIVRGLAQRVPWDFLEKFFKKFHNEFLEKYFWKSFGDVFRLCNFWRNFRRRPFGNPEVFPKEFFFLKISMHEVVGKYFWKNFLEDSWRNN